MRVVHLSYYYGNNTSGAPMAAMRLHRALLRTGVESHFVCIDQREPGENVHKLPKGRLLTALYYVVPRGLWVLSKVLFGKMYMPNLIPLAGFGKLMRALKPDVVHIHFIGQDMLSFAQIAALHCPTVITLHDLLPVNAVEPHPCADRRFAEGFMRENATRMERWMFKRKRRFVNELQPYFVGPSKWICSMLSQSLIGRGARSEVVLNIVDPVYGFDASQRKAHERFTLLFGAYQGRACTYKGWPDLEAAIGLLPDEVRANMTVNVFGENAADCEVKGVPVHFLGVIKNPAALRDAHHKADALALPSRQDNAPQVKFEALLDGLPVLAFERTGCAEYVRHKENGWVSPDGNVADYAKGIEFFYRVWQRGDLEPIRGKIAEAAKAEFSESEIVRKMIAVYERCLSNDRK